MIGTCSFLLPIVELQVWVGIADIVVNTALTVFIILIYRGMAETQGDQEEHLGEQEQRLGEQASALERVSKNLAEQSSVIEERLGEQEQRLDEQTTALEQVSENLTEQSSVISDQTSLLQEIHAPFIEIEEWWLEGDEITLQMKNTGKTPARDVSVSVAITVLDDDVRISEETSNPQSVNGLENHCSPIREVLPPDGEEYESSGAPLFFGSYNGETTIGGLNGIYSWLRDFDVEGVQGLTKAEAVKGCRVWFEVSWESTDARKTRQIWSCEYHGGLPDSLEAIVENAPPMDRKVEKSFIQPQNAQ